MRASGRKKRVLIFSPPFSGHLNILKELIRRFSERVEFRLVITGWSNLRAATGDLSAPAVHLGRFELHETDPALWTLPRSAELLDECLHIGREFKPDLILYDFFSLEGLFAALRLAVPCCVSIPAMLGPNNRPGYLKAKLADPGNAAALKVLKDKFGLSIERERFELVSDGIHLPSPQSLVWSYRSVVPPDWRTNRAPSRYVFTGNIRGRTAARSVREPRTIYLSLGTVVLGNLWSQQPETRSALVRFVAALAEAWRRAPYRVIFAAQGRRILSRYPRNWEVLDEADQIACLSQADLFVTHGGNNSFHEALLQKVPMVVIPFFGDQPLVAGCVERLGIGVNMVPDRGIGTKEPKDFLSPDLSFMVAASAERVLREKEYRQNFDRIDLETESLDEVILEQSPKRMSGILFGSARSAEGGPPGGTTTIAVTQGKSAGRRPST